VFICEGEPILKFHLLLPCLNHSYAAMIVQPFQALYPNFNFIASPDSFCNDAKHAYREFYENRFFETAPQEALYIYQIEDAGARRLGLVGLNALSDFFDGKIKKHEKTISEKEQQQMQVFLKWHAILKPILLTYPPVADIQEWLEAYIAQNKPLYTTYFEREAQTHTVWSIADGVAIRQLQDAFQQLVPCTYIADGHHRTSTMALLNERMGNENELNLDLSNLFCAYFATDQLEILDYNRVVEGLSDITPISFMARLSTLFDMEPMQQPEKPRHKHELTMYLSKEWFRLRWKPAVLDRYPSGSVLLDASLLNEWVLRDVFDIQDVRNDTRINYVEGAKGLEGVRRLVNEEDLCVGFLLYPVSFADMIALADAGESLPPKSTYFEPRMRSGLLVKVLDA